MLRYASYDIVFQEIPGEVTLAINIAGCPNRCWGCHSPHLQEDAGEELTEAVLEYLLAQYEGAITCVCFMGGDGSPEEVLRLAALVRGRGAMAGASAKTAWYSGKGELYPDAQRCFDYIKLGGYVAALGGLSSPATNQRLYRMEDNRMTDITDKLYRRGK